MTNGFTFGIDCTESTRQRAKNGGGAKRLDPNEMKTLGIPNTSGMYPDDDTPQPPAYNQFAINDDQPI